MTLQEKIERLAADQALAFLVLILGEKATLDPLPKPDQPANPSTIATLFAGWLAAMDQVNGNDGQSLTDEDVTAINGALNAAGEAILALPARDAADVWRKVVVALTYDDLEPRSHGGKLLAEARGALS